MGKRLFDVIACLGGLAVTLPLYPFIALAIRLESPGPILFRQRRVGLHGRPFHIIKFRTMVGSAAEGGPITVKGDSRITTVGKWLRRIKLDELPTLLNVLKGDMNVVGPRPEIPLYVQHYTPEQQRVLSVRPGITDLGTLRFNDEAELLASGDYHDVYVEKVIPEKLRLNLEYIDNRSFFLDLRIILKTFALIGGQKQRLENRIE